MIRSEQTRTVDEECMHAVTRKKTQQSNQYDTIIIMTFFPPDEKMDAIVFDFLFPRETGFWLFQRL